MNESDIASNTGVTPSQDITYLYVSAECACVVQMEKIRKKINALDKRSDKLDHVETLHVVEMKMAECLALLREVGE
jgi:hypothetical protein